MSPHVLHPVGCIEEKLETLDSPSVAPSGPGYNQAVEYGMPDYHVAPVIQPVKVAGNELMKVDGKESFSVITPEGGSANI